MEKVIPIAIRSVFDITAANDVLQYWYDGDQTFNYKTKWFPTGNIELQQNADTVVFDRFYDIFVRVSQFSEISSSLAASMAYLKEKASYFDRAVIRRYWVAVIIVLDQFSRHIFRKLQYPSDSLERLNVDEKALAIAIELSSHQNWFRDLTFAEFVFALMPFRHSATIERLNNVLNMLDSKESTISDDTSLAAKFRKQTVRRLQHLQDRSKVSFI